MFELVHILSENLKLKSVHLFLFLKVTKDVRANQSTLEEQFKEIIKHQKLP